MNLETGLSCLLGYAERNVGKYAFVARACARNEAYSFFYRCAREVAGARTFHGGITLSNGSEVRVVLDDAPHAFKGLRLTGVVVDEHADIPDWDLYLATL